MKNRKIRIGTALALGMAGMVWAQGPLAPTNVPGPTMKTLAQVEPRTPISSVPFTISQSGSYYLTTNLTCTGHGVIITASGVTLDLMGFMLSGDRDSSDYGVFLAGATNSAIRNVMVHNGIVRNFGYGIRAEYTQNSRFERLIAATNTNTGVFLNGYFGQCNNNTIADCTISGIGGIGIYFYGYAGQCNNNTIADCTLSANGSIGILLSGNSGQCDGNTLADCTLSGNGSYGVYLSGSSSGQCNDNTIADCTIRGNGNNGVYLTGIDSGQCDGNIIADCTISGNGGDAGVYLNGSSGQCDGNTIADCTIRKNANCGFTLYYADGNRVEGNHITGQTGSPSHGIICGMSAGNLIFRNTCIGQTNNFTINANDTYGPIVTNTGALTTTNGAAGLSPWANFSR